MRRPNGARDRCDRWKFPSRALILVRSQGDTAMQAGAVTQGRDKVGLALSGGGFRASLFHIGVLAQLADLGMLRRVEVISTVSGGSIIGALHYLYLRALLESKSD